MRKPGAVETEAKTTRRDRGLVWRRDGLARSLAVSDSDVRVEVARVGWRTCLHLHLHLHLQRAPPTASSRWHSVSLSANVLDDRKAAILKAIVEEYIQTAQPVGSGAVSRHSDLSVSSATVRNEMGVLEREGYLAQPHTSAGPHSHRQGLPVLRRLHRRPGPSRARPRPSRSGPSSPPPTASWRRMLADTSRFLSGLTDYAAVVVRQVDDPARIRSVQIRQPGARVAVVVAVLGSGAVDKHTLELSDEPSEAQVAAASAHLAAHLTGCLSGACLVVPSDRRPRGGPDGQAGGGQRS